MKKILTLIGVTSLAVALTACGGSGGSSTSGGTSNLPAFTCTGLSAAFVSGSTTPTSLSCVDSPAGTGAVLTAGHTPDLTFTGYLFDPTKSGTSYEGTVFQPTASLSTLKIGVGNFISGFDQGLLGMQVGGTRTLIIPAALAYGASPPAGSGIPANANIVFVVTLNSIVS